ncbi:asparaginase [Halocola ammonii]
MEHPGSSVLIIYTGGTIGMMENPATGALAPFDFPHLLDYMPELRRFQMEIDVRSFENPIDSSDVNPETWVSIAEIIEKTYHHYDGFVVLHGTDTIAYTASALSYMLCNLAKPVVVTGSQLPIGKLRTDGKENLITAIEIAAAVREGEPVLQEVGIFFEGQLFRGNRSRKYSTEDFDAIESPNYPKLAEVGIHIFYNFNELFRPKDIPFEIKKRFDDSVAILKLFPGIHEKVIRSMVEIPGLKGIILETFGSGNAPSSPLFLSLIKEAVEKGVIVVNVTQCNNGFVEQGRYETSHGLRDAGVTPGADMTTEAAITKLMFLLGQDLSTEQVKEQMMLSVAGELTAYSSLD